MDLYIVETDRPHIPLSLKHFHVIFQSIHGNFTSTCRGIIELSNPFNMLMSRRALYICLRDIFHISTGEKRMIFLMISKNFLLYIMFIVTFNKGSLPFTCCMYSSLLVKLHLNPGQISVSRKLRIINAWNLDRTWIKPIPPFSILRYNTWSLGHKYWS